MIVLGPGLRIHTLYNGYWFWGRPTNDELHLDLRELSRRNRRMHYPYEDAAVHS